MDIFAWMRTFIKSGYGRPDTDKDFVDFVKDLNKKFVAGATDFQYAKESLLLKLEKYPKIKILVKEKMQNVTNFQNFCEALTYTIITSELLDAIPSSEDLMQPILQDLAIKDPEKFLLEADEIGYAEYRKYEAQSAIKLPEKIIKLRLAQQNVEDTKINEIIKLLSETGTLERLAICLQEFERRAGQKRKKRAGGELEDNIKFLLDANGIMYSSGSYVGHAEFDISIPLEDGREVLISSKRSVRERWKEIVTSGKAIILQIAIEEDITYEKAKQMEQAGVIIYTRSDIANELKNKSISKIRCLSNLIKDLKEQYKAKKIATSITF